MRRLWAGEEVTLDGEQVHVEGAQLQRLPDPVPPIYFGGSSPAAGDVAGRHVDVYLTWGEPPAQVAEKIEWIRGLAAGTGPRGAVRHPAARRSPATPPTRRGRRPSELLRGIPAEMIAQVQAGLSQQRVRVGQRRMRSRCTAAGRRRPPTSRSPPTCGPASGWCAAAPGTALVGSHAEVADRIEEYHALGITEFVLSGYPHLEEAYWFGEGLLAELGRRGLWRPAAGSEAARAAAAPATAVPFAGAAR